MSTLIDFATNINFLNSSVAAEHILIFRYRILGLSPPNKSARIKMFATMHGALFKNRQKGKPFYMYVLLKKIFLKSLEKDQLVIRQLLRA